MVLFLLVNIFPVDAFAHRILYLVQLVTAVHLENRFPAAVIAQQILNAPSVQNVEDILIGIG